MNSFNRTVALRNLGCKVNAYETDAMAQSLSEKGYKIVPFEEKADVYVINTCTVTNIADRKSRQMLHRAKKLNPEACVVAVGCYVQAAGEELLKDESIDIIVGTNNKAKIYTILEEYFRNKRTEKLGVIDDISKNAEYEDMNMTTLTEHTRAFIKIQDGCNQFCTYCIIPYSRGRIRSRELDDIVREVTELAEKGYKEVVLTGIHLGSYGKDKKEQNAGLIDAIRAVNEIDGIERIRLGSLEQGIITEEFIKEVSSMKKFCPHFHLSLQSGCTQTLKRMNRHYTPDQFYKGCEIIRKYFENPALTTDVIVGFPGETEEEFLETKAFLEKVKFAEMHIFKYSKRKGTVAEKMENQVNDMIKAKRSDELIKLDEIMKKEYILSYVGEVKDVLFEEEMETGNEKYYTGYTKEYVKVAVKSQKDISNQIIEVEIKTLLNEEILLAEFI